MSQLSPIDYAVISQALIASAREMGVKLIRSAYSTILREARDGSAGLMDREGNTVAQAELIPMLVNLASDHEIFLYADTKRPFELSELPRHVTLRRLPDPLGLRRHTVLRRPRRW